MPIFTTTVRQCDLGEFQKFIEQVQPVTFTSLNNIKSTEDLNQNIFAGKVFNSATGVHTTKGRYCKVVLSNLFTSEKSNKIVSNCFDVKIVCYIYLGVDFELKIKHGDYIAVTKADVVLAPKYYNILNQYSQEILCENISKDEKDVTKPFVWVMSKCNSNDRTVEATCSASHSKQTQLTTELRDSSLTYKSLKNLKSGDECYICAVIMDKKTVSKTKRLSYIWVLFIRDESYGESDNFCLNVFFPKDSVLPVINFGDIIRCRVQADTFNGRTNAKVFNGQTCMFFSCQVGASTIPRTIRKDINLSSTEISMIEKLRKWICSEETQYLFVSDDDQRPPTALRIIPLSRIKETDKYFDLFCQVFKVIHRNECSTELLVVENFTSVNDEVNSDYPEDVTSVHVYGKHSLTARIFKTGDIIFIRNVCNNTNFPCDGDPDRYKLELTDVYNDFRLLVKCDSVQTTYLKKKLESVIRKRSELGMDELDEPSAKRLKIDADEFGWICTPVKPGRNCQITDSPFVSFSSTQNSVNVNGDDELSSQQFLELEKAMEIDREVATELSTNSIHLPDDQTDYIISHEDLSKPRNDDENQIDQHEGILNTICGNNANSESCQEFCNGDENHSNSGKDLRTENSDDQLEPEESVLCEQNVDENHSEKENEQLSSPQRLLNWVCIIKNTPKDQPNNSILNGLRSKETLSDSEIIVDDTNVRGMKNIELIDLTDDE